MYKLLYSKDNISLLENACKVDLGYDNETTSVVKVRAKIINA